MSQNTSSSPSKVVYTPLAASSMRPFAPKHWAQSPLVLKRCIFLLYFFTYYRHINDLLLVEGRGCTRKERNLPCLSPWVSTWCSRPSRPSCRAWLECRTQGEPNRTRHPFRHNCGMDSDGHRREEWCLSVSVHAPRRMRNRWIFTIVFLCRMRWLPLTTLSLRRTTW